MADHLYFCSRIRSNQFLDIFGPVGTTGWPGVVALRDACMVGRA